MKRIVDKTSDQAFLNTAAWRFIVPQLYRQYPNKDMELNISVLSPPVIQVTGQGIDTTIYIDIIVDVEDAGEVACISMVCMNEVSKTLQLQRINLINF